MNRAEYTALRRAAHSPSFVQARADDDFRRALDRIPKPKPSAIGTLIARQQNRRLYVLGMLHDRTRRRRMGIPTSQDTYAIRCVLDPTYAAREQAEREARALRIGGVQCAS